MTSAVTYMILLVSFTFNIFIFCYIGEIVAEEVSYLKFFINFQVTICENLCAWMKNILKITP